MMNTINNNNNDNNNTINNNNNDNNKDHLNKHPRLTSTYIQVLCYLTDKGMFRNI